MINHYIKIAWRNIIKNRFYSIVTIFGLSVGLAFTLVIGAYVWSELQVNKNLKNVDRQYILQSKWKDPNEGIELTTIGPLAKELKEAYPALVANYYRWDGITSNVSSGDKHFREGLQVCDSTLLSMYGFDLLYGNVATALNEPFSIVITADKALKYFGKPNVVGQLLTIESFSGTKHDFKITGVMKKPAKNSVTWINDGNDNQLFVSIRNLGFFGRNMDWQNPFIVGYIELQQGVSPGDLLNPIAHLIKQNAPPQFVADMKPYVVSLKHFYLLADNSLVKKMIYALSAIAAFILLMAIINFINMSVGRSATRMREIGIRKVLGGLKDQLARQFIAESTVIVFFAILFSLLIYGAARNLFSIILNKEIPSFSAFPLYFVLFPALLMLVIGFIAGIYPAFFLSSLKSVESLKGKFSPTKNNAIFQKSLTVFQFGMAIITLVGAIIISNQINLFLGKDLGYNKDYIISAQVPRDWSRAGTDKMLTVRNELATVPGVQNVALSYEVPNGNNMGQSYIYKFGTDSAHAIPMQVLQTDENYTSVFKIPIVAGSFFNGNSLDSGKIIMNETGARALGWQHPADAIGQKINFVGDPTNYFIKGVTNNFHFNSMQAKVAPTIFFNVQFGTIYRFLTFKMRPGNIAASITDLQKKWSVLMPGAPFEYSFMDDTLAQLYKTEMQLKKASYAATALALVIVLLGALGLISLSLQRRVKEIGIRKVLGSTVLGIISLFLKEFLLVIAIGGIMACPIAYVIMHNWLLNYAYRIPITAGPFIFSIVLLSVVISVLISLQTLKVAMTNPVKSLRTE